MQHTEILELNACISYLRTGKEVSRADSARMYDMTWTFTAPRDPAITELFVGSPGDSVWQPTAADIKAEQQRRQKERDEEARRTATPQPVQKPATSNSKELTPVPLSGLRAPLEFKKKLVAGRPQPQKSALAAELAQFKKGGGGPLPTPVSNVPSVKLTIFLPNRRGVEVRIPKTATVEQAMPLILERCREMLGGKKKPDRYELRMHDADGLPDDDFPALDRSSVISEMGSNEFCLCDLRAGEEDTDEEEPAAPTPASTMAVAPPPIAIAGMPTLTRNKSIGGEKKPNSIKILFMDNLHDQSSSILEIDPEDSRASSCLRKIVRKYRLPLFAEEYQLQIREEDKEKLGMLTSVLYPNDDVLAIGTDTILVCKRRFADAPPDADHFDHLQSTVGKEARRVSENKRAAEGQQQAAGAAGKEGAAVAAGPAVKAQPGAEVAIPLAPPLTVTINDLNRKEDGQTTPMNPNSRGVKSSATKSIKKPPKTSNAVDPDSILLNEIKAAVYEEWKVVKTNNWGKNQNRILGIDLQKIYNKPRSEGGFGQSVKHAERLTADVVSIDLNPNNPAAFTIKMRDGPGNAVVVLNYEAENADDAAKIVAKVKYIQSGLVPHRN